MPRLTTAEFIKKARAVHGDRYDYSLVDYVNHRTKVIIGCPVHGAFEQIPNNHLFKRGCPDCGGRKQLTTEIFIERAKAVHGDRYDYSQVEYVNAHTKVIIVCPVHGAFEQTPDRHLYGGCFKCGTEQRARQRIAKNRATFEADCRKVHGDRYDYSKVEYRNIKEQITIICRKHGAFRQLADRHKRGGGCPDCKRDTLARLHEKSHDQFIADALATHGKKYDYSRAKYIDAFTKVEIVCRDHGSFWQTPPSHTSGGRGCPDCAETGFNPNDHGLLYYIAITTDEGDTRYKIGITNTTIEKRFPAPDLARIRIVKTWQYAVGRKAAEREAGILRQYAGDRYYGPDILVSAGNTELFTHDILGLDKDTYPESIRRKT